MTDHDEQPATPDQPEATPPAPPAPTQPSASGAAEPQATPAAPADAPASGETPGSGTGKRSSVIVSVVVVILVLGVAVGIAAALGVFKGSSDAAMADRVPASTTVFASFSLDPSGAQKQNVAGLVEKFPALEGNDLDAVTGGEFWAELGLNYEQHVQPWLGDEVAIGAAVNPAAGAQVAFLIDSTDDAAAEDAIRAIQTAPAFEGWGWRSMEHEGVEIAAGTSPGDEEFLITVLDGAVIISPNQSYLFAVIDTIQGGDALSASADYTETVSTLPQDRLALAYVNAEDLMQLAMMGAAGTSGSPAPAEDPFANLVAFRGVGMSVSAEPDGLAMNLTTLMDPERMTDEQRQIMDAQPAPHQNTTLPFVAEDSYGVLALTGLKQTIQGTLSQLGMAGAGSMIPGLDQALEALEGDAAFAMSPGTSPDDDPNGIFLVAITDPEAAKAFMTGVEGDAIPEGNSKVKWTQSEHAGITIRHLSAPPSPGEPQFAYAVTDTMVIVGTSPEEIAEAIDSESSGADITTSSVFQESIAHGSIENDGLFFVDISKILDGIATAGELDADERAQLDPLKAFMFTATGDETRSDVELFLLID